MCGTLSAGFALFEEPLKHFLADAYTITGCVLQTLPSWFVREHGDKIQLSACQQYFKTKQSERNGLCRSLFIILREIRKSCSTAVDGKTSLLSMALLQATG
jgi:hypothetical protein